MNYQLSILIYHLWPLTYMTKVVSQFTYSHLLILSVYLKAEYPNTIFQPSISIYQATTLNTLTLNLKQAELWCIISEKISYKICSDLNIYNTKQLESIFIEILRPDFPGGIVGTIYKHPSMSVSTFNAEFFAPLLKNLNKENK